MGTDGEGGGGGLGGGWRGGGLRGLVGEGVWRGGGGLRGRRHLVSIERQGRQGVLPRTTGERRGRRGGGGGADAIFPRQGMFFVSGWRF